MSKLERVPDTKPYTLFAAELLLKDCEKRVQEQARTINNLQSGINCLYAEVRAYKLIGVAATITLVGVVFFAALSFIGGGS